MAGGRTGQLASSGLRPGWTTGACATAAAKAAWQALLTGAFPDPVEVALPQGRRPAFALTAERLGADEQGAFAMAAVTKDAGDDPDVTHGALVRATVRQGAPGTGVIVRGGAGIGTVTLPGLPVPVGEPAINPSPRRMIAENLAEVGGAVPDADVELSIDDGAELARHTWNPRIGVVGGLSVLGTTGVVVPYSCSAWIDAIRRGIDVAAATGQPHVAGCTGSTSERVVSELYGLPPEALIDMGDFVGAVLKYLRTHPRPRLTLCGGFAKLSKLAAGHLDLHSHRTSVDTAHLAALAQAAGARPALVDEIRAATLAGHALDLAQTAGIPLGDLVARAARDQALAVLAGAPVEVEVICTARDGTIVGRCPTRPPI